MKKRLCILAGESSAATFYSFKENGFCLCLLPNRQPNKEGISTCEPDCAFEESSAGQPGHLGV